MVNWAGLQLINVKRLVPIIMGYIHHYPVYLTAVFWFDLTWVTSIDNASFISMSSHRWMSISVVAFLRTLALPVRVTVTHSWTQAESVNRCKMVAFQRIAKFIPLIMASSSAWLMCCESFSGRNRQASSTTVPPYSTTHGNERVCVDQCAEILTFDASFATRRVY